MLKMLLHFGSQDHVDYHLTHLAILVPETVTVSKFGETSKIDLFFKKKGCTSLSKRGGALKIHRSWKASNSLGNNLQLQAKT